jgi:hypothetical protein
MQYHGGAQLGDGDDAVAIVVDIPDVEYPDWFGVILDGPALSARAGELAVTLLDDGIYNAWRGSATISESTDGVRRLMGHVPFTPPIGA